MGEPSDHSLLDCSLEVNKPVSIADSGSSGFSEPSMTECSQKSLIMTPTKVPVAAKAMNGGVPLSSSCDIQAMMSTLTNSSPSRDSDNSTDNSMSPVYPRTEPRNYAPKTAGRLIDAPPPSFDLSLIKYIDQTNERNKASSPVKELDPFTGSVDEKKFLRSDALNRLTNTPTGRPDLTTALSSDSFPFVDAARQAQATTHGVVKLGNVLNKRLC